MKKVRKEIVYVDLQQKVNEVYLLKKQPPKKWGQVKT